MAQRDCVCEVGPMRFRHISKKRICPECQSTEVFRVRRTGVALKLLCNVTNLRPHRCSNCDTFFLAPRQERGPHVAADLPATDQKAGGAASAGQGHLAH
jgi:hypothetical protein